MHGGEETAPLPISLFTAGIVTCFMTQLRTFARKCGVKVTGLKTRAQFDWVLRRHGQDPYTAHPPLDCIIDVEFETEASLEAQMHLVNVAAAACIAEQMLAVPVKHRLLYDGRWVSCEKA